MLEELLKGRGAFLELLAAALVLALGVNVLATTLIDVLALPKLFQFLLAVFAILSALLMIARKVVKGGRVRRSTSGIVLFDKEENELIRIPRYRLSEALCDYLNSLFNENEAMKKLWSADPLSKMFDFGDPTPAPIQTRQVIHRRRTDGANLLQEAIEYFVLERLSTHLTDYFNKPPFDVTRLKEFGREDVPSVLFKNRFLDTFSRPMAERPAFVESVLKDRTQSAPMRTLSGTIVTQFGPNRARYERFDLVLPQKSKVSRTPDGAIEIDTPKFLLHIEAVFDGFGAVLPSRFERLYLRQDDHSNLLP
jgi:hypothetical protein